MDERIRQLAKALGAEIVAELPDVGHGALGAAHYAAFYRQRIAALRANGESSGAETRKRSVIVDELTVHALEAAAELLWPKETVNASQFAAALLKGISVLILDQLIKQLEEKKEAVRKTLDAKSALLAALEQIMENNDRRPIAG